MMSRNKSTHIVGQNWNREVESKEKNKRAHRCKFGVARAWHKRRHAARNRLVRRHFIRIKRNTLAFRCELKSYKVLGTVHTSSTLSRRPMLATVVGKKTTVQYCTTCTCKILKNFPHSFQPMRNGHAVEFSWTESVSAVESLAPIQYIYKLYSIKVPSTCPDLYTTGNSLNDVRKDEHR